MDQRIFEHAERKVPRRRSAGDPLLIHRVTAHVERHIGRVDWVFHDLQSDIVHVDLLWTQPAGRRNFHTIVTCGMSQRPMHAPAGCRDCRFAELLIRLPASWKLEPSRLDEPGNHWPLRELEVLARMPHIYESWLWGSHTVANGDPPDRLWEATRFCGTILTDPTWTPGAFRALRVDRERRVRFFSVVPLYGEELCLARDGGTHELLHRLANGGVTDLLDVDRPVLVAPSTSSAPTATERGGSPPTGTGSGNDWSRPPDCGMLGRGEAPRDTSGEAP